MKQYGPLTLNQLKEMGTGTKPVQFYKKFYGWFQRVSKGVYQISPKGEAGLADYPKLVDYFLNELSKTQTTEHELE